MPDATITSTASTFGTISGTFAADQSTVTGTISGTVTGTLTGSVGVPGPAGAGVPAGGEEGQIIVKQSATDYDTAWMDNYAATLQATVRNETGATLTKGTVVYISGGAGNKPLVTKASASTEASSSKTFAILAENISTNNNGQAVTMGLLKGLDTTSFTAGANLWLSTTAGQIVSPTPPASPAHAVFLGNVVRVHATQGEIEVRIQNGLELGELHDVIIDTPANGQVLKYDSAQGLWINGTDSSGVAWGAITGTLSAQTDLQTALDGKYSTSNPSGYITSSALTGYATESWVTAGFYPLTGNPSGFITSSALTPYLTSATAASTYQTIAGMSSYLTTSAAASTYYPLSNPSGYITSSALTPYAPLAGATFTGEVITPASTTSNAGLTITPGVAPTTPTNGEIWATTNDLQVRLNGVTETIAEQSWVTAQGYITSSALTPYAPLAGATFTGKVNTVATATGGAGLNLPHGTAPTSPVNGDIWTTTSDLQVRLNGSTRSMVNVDGTQTISGNKTFSNASLTLGNSTAASTYNLGTGATLTATTKAINIGTAGVSGSTTNVTIGTSAGGTNAITLHGPTTLNGNLTATGTTVDIGNSTAASTISLGSGATISGSTKTISIGNTGASGSTTNVNIANNIAGPSGVSTINIGTSTPASTVNLNGTVNAATATAGTSTTQIATTAFVTTADNLKANLASPTFTGTPSAPTASADTNTTQLATTAYVVGQAGSATPLVDGTAAVGTSLRYARQDHVHPTDTSRAALASPTFTGVPAAPTAAVDTNTTQIATTAFVVAQAASATPLVDGTAAVGTSLRYARADHVHPTDTTLAPLASPTFTGTPTLPTGTIAVTQSTGNNTTAVATTAFVQQEVPAASTTAAGKIELATVDEALRPASSTLGMTPETTREMLMYPGYINLFGGGNVATSGTGAASTFTFATQRWHAMRSPNATIAGYGMYIFDYSFSGIGMAAMTRGVSSHARKWNNRIWVSGRTVLGQFAETTSGLNGDANCTARVMLGGRSSAGTGGMVSSDPGIGWRVAGGGSVALVMTVSNGTTLTETTSSFTPVLGQVFDWKMYSDGTGNVTLWVNDSQVATSTGGPTTSTAENYNFYCEVVEQTASATTPFSMGNFGSKVFWSQA